MIDNTLRLHPSTAAEVDRLAATYEISQEEVVRRALSLFRDWTTIRPNESLAVYNDDTGGIERLVIHW